MDCKILFTSHHHSLDVDFQRNPELDSSGRDGDTLCPVFCCPNAATLITVSPSDLTLVFLLLACRLAGSPGQLEEGTTAQTSSLLPITEGWKARFIFQDFYKGFKNVKSFTWKVKSRWRCWEAVRQEVSSVNRHDHLAFPRRVTDRISPYFQFLMFFRWKKNCSRFKRTEDWWKPSL